MDGLGILRLIQLFDDESLETFKCDCGVDAERDITPFSIDHAALDDKV